jgi:hypothetical protein
VIYNLVSDRRAVETVLAKKTEQPPSNTAIAQVFVSKFISLPFFDYCSLLIMARVVGNRFTAIFYIFFHPSAWRTASNGQKWARDSRVQSSLEKFPAARNLPGPPPSPKQSQPGPTAKPATGAEQDQNPSPRGADSGHGHVENSDLRHDDSDSTSRTWSGLRKGDPAVGASSRRDADGQGNADPNSVQRKSADGAGAIPDSDDATDPKEGNASTELEVADQESDAIDSEADAAVERVITIEEKVGHDILELAAAGEGGEGKAAANAAPLPAPQAKAVELPVGVAEAEEKKEEENPAGAAMHGGVGGSVAAAENKGGGPLPQIAAPAPPLTEAHAWCNIIPAASPVRIPTMAEIRTTALPYGIIVKITPDVLAIIVNDGITVNWSHTNSFIRSLMGKVSTNPAYTLPAFAEFKDNVSFLNAVQSTLGPTYKQPPFTLANPLATHSAPTTKPTGLSDLGSTPSTVVAAVQCIVAIAGKDMSEERLNAEVEKIKELLRAK